MPHFFIFAGEPSGDLHGSTLIRALKNHQNDLQLTGICGPLMRSEGIDGPLKMENFQVMGFSDVVKALPQLRTYFYQLVDFILKQQFDAVILIDYPGFNLRLAKALRKRGFKGKIVHYICPSVWAHGKGRIKTMVGTLDLLLTIYPFEKEYFSTSSLPVKYIGNPLVENIKEWRYDPSWNAEFTFLAAEKFIALFPGSRTSEIARHFPLLLGVAAQLKKELTHLKFICCYVNKSHLEEMQKLLSKTSLKLNQDIFFIDSRFRYEVMQDCVMGLAKSGTVTLELALLKKPTLVIYELSYLNYFVAKYLLRLNLPYYCIVNILAKKEVFPEIIGMNLSVKQISEAVQQIYRSSEQRELIRHKCQEVIDELGEKKTHDVAATTILGLFK